MFIDLLFNIPISSWIVYMGLLHVILILSHGILLASSNHQKKVSR